jgi:hypothetical protein
VLRPEVLTRPRPACPQARLIHHRDTIMKANKSSLLIFAA